MEMCGESTFLQLKLNKCDLTLVEGTWLHESFFGNTLEKNNNPRKNAINTFVDLAGLSSLLSGLKNCPLTTYDGQYDS